MFFLSHGELGPAGMILAVTVIAVVVAGSAMRLRPGLRGLF